METKNIVTVFKLSEFDKQMVLMGNNADISADNIQPAEMGGEVINAVSQLIAVKKQELAILEQMLSSSGSTAHTTAMPDTSPLEDFEYTVNEMYVTVTAYKGECTRIAVPKSKNAKIINRIDGAFMNLSALESAVIPDTVAVIGTNSFRNCISLKNVTLSQGIISIGEFAFHSCTSLTNIVLPLGVTSIGSSAFGNCTNMTCIIIPDSVEAVGEYTFYGCKSLENITIPKGVTAIGRSVFHNCINLKNIIIPDTVASISSSAFYGCTGLTVHCAKGSYAEQYAVKNNIAVAYL